MTDTERGATLFSEFMTTVQGRAGKAFAAGNDEGAMRIFIDAFDGVGAFDGSPGRTTGRHSAECALLQGSDLVVGSVPESVEGSSSPGAMSILIVRGANTDEPIGSSQRNSVVWCPTLNE